MALNLKLYNTLTRQTEAFIPLREGAVGMYNCGPTVYNYAHIGNLRAYVFADVLRRTLEVGGFSVKQIVNITDVGHLVSDADEGEDKMEKGARLAGKTAQEIAEFYTRAFFGDLEKLNIQKAEVYPKATEHIPEQIALIETLEEKGYTYRTSDGVYFDTSKFPRYGKFAGLNIEGQKEGARVEANIEKKNPTDFALWKFSGEEKRQQEWDAPWGIGFPGWHIECSAMSMKYLGETFDIHTGGIDHIPVHHTNEIAQSECATGKKFANYWLHSGFVNVEGEKMAKSAGNFVRMQTLEEKGISPLAYRYWLLTAHYRTTINFTWETIKGAEITLERLRQKIYKIKNSTWERNEKPLAFDFSAERIANDDLDTPTLLSMLHEIINSPDYHPEDKIKAVKQADAILGLRLFDYAPKSTGISDEEIPVAIQTLLEKRAKARAEKDWKKSDALRDEIADMEYKVTDTDEGQKVSRV
ncbi:MAG: cysteine--tRNA ligase [Parcubacteria group bacterium]|nr:cysteine--tRNA ligase [Parcubacteria group bacterium]